MVNYTANNVPTFCVLLMSSDARAWYDEDKKLWYGNTDSSPLRKDGHYVSLVAASLLDLLKMLNEEYEEELYWYPAMYTGLRGYAVPRSF